MSSPVYEVQTRYNGKSYVVPVKAIPCASHYWMIGYVSPTGRPKMLKVRSGEHIYKSEPEAVERLKRIAKERGWQKWHEAMPQECIGILEINYREDAE